MKSDYLKKVSLLVIALIVGLVAVLPGTNKAKATDEVINIGILQYMEHESLTANRKGFEDRLKEKGYVDGDNITINYLNANADTANLQSMSEKLVNQSDYIFGIATPAVQSLASVSKDVSIYFSSISDPVGAGLVESLDQPGGNITGTTDQSPLEEQIQLLRNVVPDAKKVGLIYNSGEANSVSEVERAVEIIEAQGLEAGKYSITSTNDINQVMGNMIEETDVIFLVTDSTIASAMTLVGDLAKAADLAVIGGSQDMCEVNGLATYGLNYYDLGQQTADMLIRHLEEGVEIKDQAVEKADKLNLIVNEDYAQAIGIDPATISID